MRLLVHGHEFDCLSSSLFPIFFEGYIKLSFVHRHHVFERHVRLARNVRFEHRTGKPATDHLYRGRSKAFCAAVVRWVQVDQVGGAIGVEL